MNPTTSCIIVDDEPLAVELLKGYIEQLPQLNLIGTCNSAIEAFQLLNQHSVDLLLLNIEMPEMSGLDFIKSLASPPKVILTTAYREYAIEGYEVDVIDYLLKPISLPRFIQSIEKYKERQIGKFQKRSAKIPDSKSKGSMYVYSEKKNIKVNFEDILYQWFGNKLGSNASIIDYLLIVFIYFYQLRVKTIDGKNSKQHIPVL